MLLRNPFTGAFGLDIGDLSIKLIQLEPAEFFRKHYFRLKELRATSLPPGLIVNGEIQQPEMVLKKLLFLLGKDGGAFKSIRSPWVVANLPEPKTFLKLINIETSDNVLTSVDIAYQAKKHLPFELEDAYLDWQVINPAADAKNTQVLIGAVPKTTADSYTYLLESAGLHPTALEIEAVPLARALITAEKDYTGQARAILDIGATRSSLIIYDNHSIQFSMVLNFSGELITSAIELGLKIEHAAAENLKIKNGLKYDAQNPKYLTVVSVLAENLVNEIKTALLFYKEHFGASNTVKHITMCGGVANWENLDNFLSRQLKITSRPGHPWKNLFNKKLYDYDNEKSLSLACVIGLALRAAQNPLQNPNQNI